MFIIYIIAGVIAGVVGANMAKTREQNPALWFVVGFLIPIAVVGLLFIEEKKSEKEDNKKEDDKEVFNITLKDIDLFKNAKELLNNRYNQMGYTKVVIDNDDKYFLSNLDSSKGYIVLTLNENSTCELLAFRVGEDFDRAIFNSIVVEDKLIKEEVIEEKNMLNNATTSPADELLKLAELKEKGLLSEDEFNIQKSKLLS